MNICKRFLTSYSKIIAVAIVFLAIVFCLSTIVNLLQRRNQSLESSDYTVSTLKQGFDYYSDIVTLADSYDVLTSVGNVQKLGRIINLEPGDINNKALMDAYTEGFLLSDIQVFDTNKTLIYSKTFKDYNDIDVREPYYDSLFSNIGEDGISYVADRENENVYVVSIKEGDYYYICRTDKSLFDPAADSEILEFKAIVHLALAENQQYFIVDEKGKIVDSSVNISDNGTNIDKASINSSFVSNINGRLYIAREYEFEYYGSSLILAANFSDVLIESIKKAITDTILFLFIVFLLISFIVCLRQGPLDPEEEFEKGGKFYLKNQVKQFKSMAFVCAIVFSAAMYLMFTINAISDRTSYLKTELASMESDIEEIKKEADALKKTEERIFVNYGRIAENFTKAHGEYVSKDGLKTLAKILDVKGVTVFGSDGQTVATSTTLDHLNIYSDDKSPLYEIKNVLVGLPSTTVSGDPALMSAKDKVSVVLRRGEGNLANGAVAIITENGTTNAENEFVRHTSEEIENALLTQVLSTNSESSFGFVADDLYNIYLHPDNGYVGTNVEEYSVDVKNMKEGEFSEIKIENDEYIVLFSQNKQKTNYIYIVDKKELVPVYLAIRLLIILAVYVLLVRYFIYDGLGSRYHFEERAQKCKDPDDWKRTKLTWEEKNLSQKMGVIIKGCVYVFSLIIIVLMALVNDEVVPRDGLGYIVSGDWPKVFNEFSLVGNILVVCITYSVIKWVEFLFDLIAKNGGNGVATGCKLISSIIKYAGGIVCLFIVITNFGVDTTTALASAGIIGFAITFGAKDIIKDLIAGMFILFEGNFKVGDMLKVDGDWYWVKSIGVRTTRLEAWGQVKIVNNSKMTNVKNIENANEMVHCDILIGNEYDIEKIKEILEAELPEIRDLLPDGTTTPEIKGVQGFDGVGYTLRISSFCPPIRRGRVSRTLRGEIKRIFDAHGIKLPLQAIEIKNFEEKGEGIISNMD